MATHGRLRRPNPEGRQAGGTPDRTAHEVRARDQPQDGQGAGPDDAANATAAGGPADPVMDRRAFITIMAGSNLASPVGGEDLQAKRIVTVVLCGDDCGMGRLPANLQEGSVP